MSFRGELAIGRWNNHQLLNYSCKIQGPNKYSVNDFWRMIWQVKATRIVMITNLVESGKPKCNLYWPAEKESCLYGKFHVKLLSQEINPDYTIRSFQVSYLSFFFKVRRLIKSAVENNDAKNGVWVEYLIIYFMK